MPHPRFRTGKAVARRPTVPRLAHVPAPVEVLFGTASASASAAAASAAAAAVVLPQRASRRHVDEFVAIISRIDKAILDRSLIQ